MIFSPADGPRPDDDAHGRAALLLVESLIHELTACSALTVAQGVSIMEVALDTQLAMIDDADHSTPSMQKVAALLTSLVDSLRIDLPRDQPEKIPEIDGA